MRRSRANAVSRSSDFGRQSDSPGAGQVAQHPGQLQSQLNGRALITPEGRWKIEVFAVSQHAGFRWVQLTLRGRPSHVLTLRVGPGQGAFQVLEALADWLKHPLTIGEILDVCAPLEFRKQRRPS